MSPLLKWTLVGGVLLVGWWFARGGAQAAESSRPEPTQQRAEAAVTATASSARTRASVSAAAAEPAPSASAPAVADPFVDEAALMRELRRLHGSSPEAALALARRGDVRYPGGPGAPERGWVAARALVDLRRFDEAVTLAKELVARYPADPWVNDVERHLLTHPMRAPGAGEQR